MTPERIAELGDELFRALRSRSTVPPLTAREPGISIEEAYAISLRLLERRVEEGERVIGKKIGVTSHAVQSMLGVHQPDFGYLTDQMRYRSGEEMPIGSSLIQPRAEGEIAFVLGKDLRGPGVTEADVLSATDHVVACFEVVDSRVRDWAIKIQDTVADNASSGLFVLGEERADPRALDLAACRMEVEKNGKALSKGTGAVALGSPLTCVAWLANMLGSFGVGLYAGEIILSGSLVPLEPVQPGDVMTCAIEGIGRVAVRFT